MAVLNTFMEQGMNLRAAGQFHSFRLTPMKKNKRGLRFGLPLCAWFLASAGPWIAEAKCGISCDTALGSYYIIQGINITYILNLFNNMTFATVQPFNRQITNPFSIKWDTRMNIPFSCDCQDEAYLGHRFQYTVLAGDTYEKIAGYYANLTTSTWLAKVNPSYNKSSLQIGSRVNVTVNCSCGDPTISRDYGFFLTYPKRENETLADVATKFNIGASLLRKYSPNAPTILFVPVKDENGSYRPFTSSSGIGAGAIAGISIGVISVLLLGTYGLFYKRKKTKKSLLQQLAVKNEFERNSANKQGDMRHFDRNMELDTLTGNTPRGRTDVTVDKSVEFSYQELAEATNDFNIANKIGEGGFGAVYYAELRGEKAAIKKMDMQATKEFLAELNVLTHVHHLNLVRLIGFCIESSLFLVYEFIENGNLSQHLHGSGMDPLSWPARVQIALDSARGLEYIHEHTVPVYIHRDIKSANILIDKNFRSKVADFGLTKLTEVGGASMTFPTRLVGTFGYMPPEYAQFGDVSPKVDVYAFGVVLFEIISAKEAIVKVDEVSAETKGLVTLFDGILKDPDGRKDLPSLIDPRLGNNYPLESVWKMAQLARACTQENPQLRPSMRAVVVALMTLSSSTEDWDVGSFYENRALVNLASGR